MAGDTVDTNQLNSLNHDALSEANKLLALLRTLDCSDSIKNSDPSDVCLIIEIAREKAELLRQYADKSLDILE